ncbi:MAG: universal stress protein [Sphingomonas sp.]|jgi:nucleotide-binding universal stress UspA family protein|uniref:universal stress protein n=1 Tax=Sphingomonas sp. TaxID=28214 RepID=UPI003561E2D1
MQRILVAANLTPAGMLAIRRACDLASGHCADVRLVHVVKPSARTGEVDAAQTRADEAAREAAVHYPCVGEVSACVLKGALVDAVCREAEAYRADLIVAGAHADRDWRDSLFGTAGERIMHAAGPPVLIVRHDATGPYRRVLAAVDTGMGAAGPLRLACQISSADTIFAVHAFAPNLSGLVRAGGKAGLQDLEQRELEKAVRDALAGRTDLSVHVQAAALPGDPTSAMISAWEVFRPDLLVVASHGRSGLARILVGSVADSMIDQLPFDMLVQRLPAGTAADSSTGS